MDPAGIPALIEAIRHMHSCDATWIESVPVHETHGAETVWKGEVQVFDLTNHPEATRAYAWSHESGPGGRRRFYAVLHAGQVRSAAKAVQASILTDAR